MTSNPIIPWFTQLIKWGQGRAGHDRLTNRPDLHHLAQQEGRLPRFVRESPVAMRYLHLLGLLAWHQFPERDLQRN